MWETGWLPGWAGRGGCSQSKWEGPVPTDVMYTPPCSISLALERRLADRFVPGLRREVFNALEDAPRDTLSLDGGFQKIDLRGPRPEGLGSD